MIFNVCVFCRGFLTSLFLTCCALQDPIYVERGGATDAGALIKKYGPEELVKFAIWTRELHTRGAWIDRFEKIQGRRIRGVTVVYDLKGLCSKHLNKKVLDLFGAIMKVSHANYPGPIKVRQNKHQFLLV